MTSFIKVPPTSLLNIEVSFMKEYLVRKRFNRNIMIFPIWKKAKLKT